MTEDREEVARLLMILWRGVSAGYKKKYARNIWEQYENAIRRTMSSTNSLERFVNSLCSKFDSDIGKNAGDREEMLKLMQKLNGPKALNLIRQETKMLVLMVRVANQESKEKYREDHPELFEDEEEIEKENMQGGLFDE